MNLKKIRLEKGLTQEKVAKDLSIGRASYNRYELGLTDPSIENLIKIADYFHSTIDAVIGHEVQYLLDKSILNPECQKAIDRITKLTEYQCKLINTYIDGILVAEEDKQKTITKFKGE